MSLRTWLRDWLNITDLDEDTDAGLRMLENKMIELNGKLNTLDAHQRKFDVLLEMPIDFRLAQAANSLKLLTSFINEIQHDQNNEIHKANVNEQLRRRSDAHKDNT